MKADLPKADGSLLKQITAGPSLDVLKPSPGPSDSSASLAQKSAFAEDTDPPLTMEKVADALGATLELLAEKRTDQREKVKQLKSHLQSACDILNALDL